MTLFAFEVDGGLRVRHAWPADAVAAGTHFLQVFDESSAPAAVAFAAELSDLGVAFGRLPLHGVLLRVSATLRGESALVVASSGDAEAVAWLATMEGPSARLLRRLLERLATADPEETHRLYAELTQLNNELSTLHRELAVRTRDLEHANALLERQAAELRRLNEEKNRFIGIAAHDLRSPIGSILVFAESVLDIEGADPEAVSLAKEIMALSRAMATLVDEILNVSAIESGTFRLERSVLDLNEAASRSVSMHRHQASRKSIEVRVERAPVPALVHADAGKIDQVLNNLVTNALKFSYPGDAVDVTVTAEPDGVSVSVRDRGVGIAADEQSRLFLPFGKLSARSTAGEPNTGLGLAIVRRIVEAHGGRIEVLSAPGQGSTFSFWLPRDAGQSDQAEVARSAPASAASTAPGTSR